MRVFYSSENGDEWGLVREAGGTVSVRHRPNAASGGESRMIELGSFLTRERNSPQGQALQQLFATLITDPAADGATDTPASTSSPTS